MVHAHEARRLLTSAAKSDVMTDMLAYDSLETSTAHIIHIFTL